MTHTCVSSFHFNPFTRFQGPSDPLNAFVGSLNMLWAHSARAFVLRHNFYSLVSCSSAYVVGVFFFTCFCTRARACEREQKITRRRRNTDILQVSRETPLRQTLTPLSLVAKVTGATSQKHPGEAESGGGGAADGRRNQQHTTDTAAPSGGRAILLLACGKPG